MSRPSIAQDQSALAALHAAQGCTALFYGMLLEPFSQVLGDMGTCIAQAAAQDVASVARDTVGEECARLLREEPRFQAAGGMP